MPSVAITPRAFRQVAGAHIQALREGGLEPKYPSVDRMLNETEMVLLVAGCSALIVGLDPVTRRVLEAGPLQVVAKFGSGVENIDLDAARLHGVRVVRTPAANARSVAELTVGLLLALARRITDHDRLIHQGVWQRDLGVELAGKQLGLVGYGAVARQVARIALALDMKVVAHDPYVHAADVPLVDLQELLRSSDAVSIHVPLTSDTRTLIGAQALDSMRPGSFLINTSRGGIVDEQALYDALVSGRLGGAALDVFQEEPVGENRLLECDNFIASPHAGAATREAAEQTGVAAVRAVLRALAGASMPEEVVV